MIEWPKVTIGINDSRIEIQQPNPVVSSSEPTLFHRGVTDKGTRVLS
jgi:hypothetical protein